MIMWLLHLRFMLRKATIEPLTTNLKLTFATRSEREAFITELLMMPDLELDMYEAVKRGQFTAYGVHIELAVK